MLNIGTIIANIKKGQSALKVKAILNKLEQNYQRIKSSLVITGCKKEASQTTVYLTIPSESTPGVTYDIVLELHSIDRLNVDTKFKVYTNSPSFAYNFAYVFNTNGSLLWPEKYPPEFKKLAPATRNPFMFVGFDRHVFAAIRFVSEYGLGRVIGEFDGAIPGVKTFQEKIKQIKDIREDMVRSES